MILRFGGPALPPGTHTWYRLRDGAICIGRPGDVVNDTDMEDPDYYIRTERALRIAGAEPHADDATIIDGPIIDGSDAK